MADGTTAVPGEQAAAYAADTLAGEPTAGGSAHRPSNRESASSVEPATRGYQRDMPEQPPTPGTGDLQSAGTGELVSRLSAQVSELVRAELALARSELRTKGARLGMGAGLAGGAGLLAVGGLHGQQLRFATGGPAGPDGGPGAGCSRCSWRRSPRSRWCCRSGPPLWWWRSCC